MATLYINGETLDIAEIAIQTPIAINSEEAWSTDFDLPFGAEVMRAFKIDSFMGIAGQVGKTHSGMLQVGGNTWPCVVRATGLEDGMLKCWLSAIFTDERLARRVCDIATAAGSEMLFQYFLDTNSGNYDANLKSLEYETGSGHTEVAGIMPSLAADKFVDHLCNALGISHGSLAALANTYITPTDIKQSPLIKRVCGYSDGGGGNYTSDSVYCTDVMMLSPSNSPDFRFTLDVDVAAITGYYRKRAADVLKILVNGTTVQTLSNGDPDTTETFILTSVAKGSQIDVVVQKPVGDFTNANLSLYCELVGVADDVERCGREYEPIRIRAAVRNFSGDGVETYANTLDWYKTGYFACITQTFADVCNDLATILGLIVVFDNGTQTLDFIDPLMSFEPLNRYKITAYNFAPDGVGKVTTLEFSNDKAEILREYDNDNIEDEAAAYTVKAAKGDFVEVGGLWYVAMPTYENYEYQHGDSYMINWSSGVGRLAPLTVSQSTLVPVGDIIGVTVRTPESFKGSMLHFDDRLWLVTDKTIGADGITEFNALLYK